jgi:hypothetical protein
VWFFEHLAKAHSQEWLCYLAVLFSRGVGGKPLLHPAREMGHNSKHALD